MHFDDGKTGLHYHAPWWMPGGNLQTILPPFISKSCRHGLPIYQRERLDTPDGDFVDVDHLVHCRVRQSREHRPLLVLFHGLEGSSSSHYALAFADHARHLGWDCAIPHFRGCSGELNRAPRAYHSGDYAEVGWLLQHLTAGRRAPRFAVGVSLGGNALLRWVQEAGPTAGTLVDGVAAISAPLDLAASGASIDQGFNRQVYVRNFLRTMQPRARMKHDQFPGSFDLGAVLRARTLYEFDNAFTAPLHGFRDTDDYWHRASAIHGLRRIHVPTLVINARNDPFVPAHSLPTAADVSEKVSLFQPPTGGHVGFASGRPPGHIHNLPQMVGQWLKKTNKDTDHG